MTKLHALDFQSVTEHLSTKKHFNMHLRKTDVVRGERIFRHVNILMAQSPTLISGHVFGPGIDVEYEIFPAASGAEVRVLRSSMPLLQTLDLLTEECKAIVERVLTDQGKPWAKYKKGYFYIRRSPRGGVHTAAMDEAIESGVFPKSATKNILSWGFMVVKGQK